MLTRDGEAVHLTPKAFELLALLVSRRPRAISKAELLETVWPDTFVTDASLARTIHEIRVAIGDHKDGSTIRTVHGHGYAFVADGADEPVGPAMPQPGVAPAPPRAWLVAGLHMFPLTVGTHVAGRDPSVAIPLDAVHASWHHAQFQVTGAAVTVTDLGSKNGTYVNGRREATATRLQDGDAIRIGTTTLVFRAGERPVGTITAEHEPDTPD